MKVVLFCGGLGMRLREVSENIPKPMVPIGYRPIIWHLMKYYAHYGHNDFILALGHKADTFKSYFLNYQEWLSNDFTLDGSTGQPRLLHTDIHDWKITFVDTGVNSNIGMRLKAVEKHLAGEEAFLANYSDGLTDLPLDKMIAFFREKNKVATFMSVHTGQSFHTVTLRKDGMVESIQDMAQAGLTINGGFFCFKQEIFQYIRPGEELVHEPFQRLIAKGELTAYQHDGFWGCMDTFKDKQRLDDLYAKGDAPWEVWKKKPAGTGNG
jgi:glucose-1-phosphate cytidylyltransferase